VCKEERYKIQDTEKRRKIQALYGNFGKYGVYSVDPQYYILTHA
jgi:hypothetical protein